MRPLLIIFFVSFFTCCSARQVPQKTEGSTYKQRDSFHSSTDPFITAFIAPYQVELNYEVNKAIAAAIAMEKNQPEGLPGNFVADLSLYVTNITSSNNKADFCLLNNGGLRSTLPRRDITIKRVYELMPFENELVILTLDGPTTQLLIEFIAKKGGMPVSGIMMGIKNEKPIDVLIDEKSFDVTKDYKVVTSDYLANGGDNLSFLTAAKERKYVGIKVKDAIIKFIVEQHNAGKKLEASIDSKIYNE